MDTVADPSLPTKLVLGSLEVVPGAYRATLGGTELQLTPAQVDLLVTLVANTDRVVTRAELARSARIDQRSVDVVLTALRRVLGEGFVRNVRNRGWILEPDALQG
jgi:DNA-binding response OmpR family regulator